MSLLIDADYIVYKDCAACEIDTDFGDDVIVVQSDFKDVQRRLTYSLDRIKSDLNSDDLILFFSSSNNFRKELLPSYKGHRNRKKPCGYKRAIEWLSESYRVIKLDGLEADDALGIYATAEPGHTVVSPDKDLRQIPGLLYDFTQTLEITPEEGRRWHLTQTLSGDQTDGYGGCPGIGIKRAEALFDKHGCQWSTVLKAFLTAGLTEADALLNARLARILQHVDYDGHRPILWSPTSDAGDDPGATAAHLEV